MKSYLYILGRTQELAFLELQTFLPDVTRIAQEVARSNTHISIEKLGGTVKIAEIVTELLIEPKSTFGISVYSAPQVPIKKLEELKAQFHASRFVTGKNEPLSSVVVKKNKVQEFIMVHSLVGKTIEVQDFEEWSRRDYGRPNSDPKAGMLPPKVARMAVNLAGVGRGKTLLDPFCGMGTILAEALLMGWNVVGSDISPDVVEKAKGNLRWLMEFNKLGVTYRLQASDAVHVSDIIDHQTIDAIVTEPFMGNPDATAGQVKNIIKGLEKLYIGCLKDWYKVLKPDGVVIIALPQYQINGKTYFVKKVIDMCEILGYTIQAGPIEYSRPQAVVRRNFYIFRKK